MSKEAYSLWLVGGTALLVDDDTAQPALQYALDSVLFAQLRADKLNGSRFARYRLWYSDYRKALEERGWIITLSHSDHLRMHDGTTRAPADGLIDYLQSRHPNLTGHLKAAINTLSHDEVQQYVQPFTQATQDKTTHVVQELGVLLPGAVLDLCGVAFKTPLPSGDGIDLRASVATLGDFVTEANRKDLHDLLERKQRAVHIRNLGLLTPENDHAST
jgi:hypothetical protein